jgi:hypothetical protein
MTCKKGHSLDVGGMCPVCDYDVRMGLSLSLYQVEHLKAGLVEIERAGHCVDLEMHDALKETLDTFIKVHPLRLRPSDKNVKRVPKACGYCFGAVSGPDEDFCSEECVKAINGMYP